MSEGSPDWPAEKPDQDSPRPSGPRPPRWGVRTLIFLGLAVLAIFVSSGQGKYTLLTLGLLLVGLVGAVVCSIRGLFGSTWGR